MKQGESIKLPQFRLIFEFTHGVSVPDFIKLKSLCAGMMLEVDMTASGKQYTKMILVGNCTEYSQPTTNGFDWDWDVWNYAKILRVFMLDADILETNEFLIWKNNIKATFKEKAA